MSNKFIRALASSGMNETKLSEQTGFTVTYIHAIAEGKLPPSPSFKKKVAEVLKIDADVLFAEDAAPVKKMRWY